MTSPYLRGDLAAPPRTLVDVLDATVAAHPDATAVDDGHTALTYAALAQAVHDGARRLAARGIGPGDRVGVRVPSGTAELYVTVLAVLAAGAAYVPVDVDDPQERADTVFREARVRVVLGEGDLVPAVPRPHGAPQPRVATPTRPGLDDDAWIIFTSGSTGTPKGVAVTHRSAAAFVDAEARLFLQDAPLGPGDRVLAGLSVAFDASCEEMWLAWRYGACLVPAPRALVRTGMDLGPWLVAQRVTVISTVPTLAGLWPADDLAAVRLLIFGGEACPPELAARLVAPGREVWNTYGPTEATVVACAARLDGVGPVRIGHALDGWDLAVVAPDGTHVPEGGTGELVIGGVGLARYLDTARDAERFASAPDLGWDRAYRSGDLVRYEPAGLVFLGRADDQVKVGGRRIELGEVDAALAALPDVGAAAAAVRRTPAGTSVLVGYLAPLPGTVPDLDAARVRLRSVLPAALVPVLAVVDEIPTRGSGKVDRDALPWPLAGTSADETPAEGLDATQEWVAGCWTAALGATVRGPDDDFFAAGGGSLVAAQLVAALRARFPTVTVADVYEHPRLADLARRLDELAPAPVDDARVPAPVPWRTAAAQWLLGLPPAALVGLRWLTWALGLDAVLTAADVPWAPAVPGAAAWWALGWVLLVSPAGRMGSTVLVARTVLRGVAPGRYPRGGPVHLRLWFTEQWAAAAGAGNLSCAPWTVLFARALGARVGSGVDLHAAPPLTGHLVLGDRCAIEPEVDLSGYWVDGDVLHVGRVRVDKRATVGTRSTLGPGSRVGQGAEVAPGTVVTGSVPPGELWAGSPASFEGRSRERWPRHRPPRGRRWVAVYGISAALLSAVPLVALAAALAAVGTATRDAADLADALRAALPVLPLGALAGLAVVLVVTWTAVRLLATGLAAGSFPVRSRQGWQAWATLRLMDDARGWLYPLYASSVTPAWLRALGARVGRDVEASTVLLLPSMASVGDGAFLADDTLVGSYELGGGYLRVEPARIGKRAFLGNSGMIAPGRAVPSRGLVAVLSATPERAKKGTSWLGSPPQRLRRVVGDAPDGRTFDPPARLRVARAFVEACRLVPVVLSFTLVVLVLATLWHVLDTAGLPVAVLAATVATPVAALVACVATTTAKWALVGRVRAEDHPLWSGFVWRNELADAFVEVLAVPWLGPAALGSPALTWWLRSLGARIGRGVWLESYWLPEADLVTVGDGATVNRGCVLQTHLFHDRVMSLDTVHLEKGTSLGPHGVLLPAARLQTAARVGAGSLVLRGDVLPAGTHWAGNPVMPA